MYEDHTQLYWKTLYGIVEDYIDHPEKKFRNGHKKGNLQRRHLRVTGRPVHIGKEANEIEETEKLGVSKDSYVEYSRNKK